MKATKSGFTLVEILIVVVILGILAAIVIPQFTDAATEAKESSLKTDLQAIRSQIELYKIQHTDELPGNGTASFYQCMEGKTDVYGAVWSSGVSYGPYMQSLPKNPFNDQNSVEINGSAGSNDDGWQFTTTAGDPDEGLFRADDDACSPDGTAHIDW